MTAPKFAEKDLVAGVLARAFAYLEIPVLLKAFRHLAGGSDSDLVAYLKSKGELSPRRAEKLDRGAWLTCLLRDEAVYGSVALQNKLIGMDMLNALMDETKKSGFKSNLGLLLQDKGIVTETLHAELAMRKDEALEQLRGPQDLMAESFEAEKDDDLASIKLEILLGEVATKLSFLTRAELEVCLKIDGRVRKGLPAVEEAPKQAASSSNSGGIQMPVSGEITESDPIAGYEVQKKLGQGAMGAVFKARKHDTNEIVALKVLKPDLSGDHEFVQRFLREAKAVARLNHKNVITAVDVGKSGNYYYFAMEYIEGESCSEVIKRQGMIAERPSLSICKQIALALDHAWTHKIIHRDVKPDNIMVTKQGVGKLTDLGLARTAKRDSSLTLTGVVMGSPAYISPEQATGEKNLDTRSDIYSLGATLYHMLTGVVPYDGESPLQVMLRHMNDPLPDVRVKMPMVSEGTRQLIFKMMAKRPESRFQNARRLYEAIVNVERLLDGASVDELSRSQVSAPAAARLPTGSGAPAPSGSGVRRRAGPASSGVKRAGPASSGVKRAGAPSAPAKGSSGESKPKGKGLAPKATSSGKTPSKPGGKSPTAKSKKNKEIGERLKKRKRRV